MTSSESLVSDSVSNNETLKNQDQSTGKLTLKLISCPFFDDEKETEDDIKPGIPQEQRSQSLKS